MKIKYKSGGFSILVGQNFFMTWNLFELVSYSKFSFSRPNLDGTKAAKGKCLARKQEIKKCLSSDSEGPQFFLLN